MDNGRKGPSMVMLALVSSVVAITVLNLLVFAIVRSKHRSLVRLRRDVMSGMEAAGARAVTTGKDGALDPKKKRKKRSVKEEELSLGEETLNELLERNLGPTLHSLLLAQGWTISDERVKTLVKGIVDPEVGQVLEELMLEILI